MKNLVIVESPAKAKTLSKFLGPDYVIRASMGHIRDLPEKGDTLTAAQKKLPYAKLGIDIEHDFEPLYVIKKDKKRVVDELKALIEKNMKVWIATDEDREGEAIGWHLTQALKLDPKTVHRIVFHEITKPAILEAIKNPRHIYEHLVDAQQARRILDRLVGYELSPLLWKKIRFGLSAGRVQSVAVRLVVEREREILKFVPEEFWRIKAFFKDPTLETELSKIDGKKLDHKKVKVRSADEAQKILDDLKGAKYSVASIEQKEVKSHPSPPFTTSTLQQEASRKLGFSVKQTMMIAQQLYEGNFHVPGVDGGLITYMRTDSVSLSQQAISAARDVINEDFGPAFGLPSPRYFKTKSKGAQEAHEAIRPTNPQVRPSEVKAHLDNKQFRLYDLIWKKTIACQMKEATLENTVIEIDGKRNSEGTSYTFAAEGKVVKFPGYLKVYTEGGEKLSKAMFGDERILPDVHEGQVLHFDHLDKEQHFTKPPARYTEASLVKKLESEGIGRPSTYAPTISTIETRGYVEKLERKLHATDIAMVVTDFLVEYFPDIMDYKFTAKVEEDLDRVADNEIKWVPMMREFYAHFNKEIGKTEKSATKAEIFKERILGKDPNSDHEIVVRRGRFGPYVQVGTFTDAEIKTLPQKPRRASIPKDMLAETITMEQALKLLSLPRDLGSTPEGEMVSVHKGPFGFYFKVGTTNIGMPETFDPYTITLEASLAAIIEAKAKKLKMMTPLKTFDKPDPSTGKSLQIREGRFGPYVTDGETNASLRKSHDPASLTFEEAVELIEKKRKSPKKFWIRRGGQKGRKGKGKS